MEFFPPKTESGTRNLYARLARMALLGPLFVTITWGAGGSTSDKSLDLAQTCQNELALTTCLHLTCTNTSRAAIDEVLQKAKASGIKNILALRGDPPRDADKGFGGDFHYATDLVKYIREKHGDYFCIGVAGYPEGHAEGTFEELHQDPNADMPYLVEKVQAGADFIITQLFYDSDKYLAYEQLVRAQHECLAKIPIIPGLLPINGYSIFQRASRLSHASVPDKVLDKFPPEIRTDDDAVKAIGVEVIKEIITDVCTKSPTTKGVHFYTLNLEKSIAQIINSSPLLCQVVEKKEREMAEASDSSDDEIDESITNSNRLAYSNRFKQQQQQPQQPQQKPKQAPHAQPMENHSSSNLKKLISISAGHGSLGKDATWDDFPNGRFGDSRSPAYGEIDGYGPSLKVSPTRAYELWGYPKTQKDISKIFVKYLTKTIDCLPWSELSLNAETALIQEELIELNEKNFFTIASQPAVNCCKSQDKIIGWGPPNGYLYQKAFVEMFVSKATWEKELLPKLQKEGSLVSYYTGDFQKNYNSNLPSTASNCVTWGVFPDREILQTTIIEEDSFKAWSEEAFEIWKEWMYLYPKNSDSAKLIQDVLDSYYLVTVVHHDYPNESALWDLLLS